MRALVLGGSLLGELVAKSLVEAGYEVVIVERDKERADELSSRIDCMVLVGDPAMPDILHEAGVEEADTVIVVGNDDKENIIAAIIARRLSEANIIVKIDDPRYNKVLVDMGIHGIVNPIQQTLVQILHMVARTGPLNLSMMQRGDARFMLVKAPASMKGRKLGEIKLPESAAVAAIYRGDKYIAPKPDTEILPGDELLIVTRHGDAEKVEAAFAE